MKWLWIFLSIALALGPVMWMMPSTHQKRLASLRARAQALGLEVKIAAMPQLHRAQIRKEAPLMGALYRLRFAPQYAAKHHITEWLACRAPDTREWDEQSIQAVPLAQRQVLQTLLAQLPDDVAGIDQNIMGIAIYWRELADVSVVDNLLSSLQQLQAVSA
jgi:hypothetical protein